MRARPAATRVRWRARADASGRPDGPLRGRHRQGRLVSRSRRSRPSPIRGAGRGDDRLRPGRAARPARRRHPPCALRGVGLRGRSAGAMTVAVNRSRVQGVIRTSHRATRLTARLGRRSLKVRRARRTGPGGSRPAARAQGSSASSCARRARTRRPMALRVNARRAVSARLSVTTRAKAVAMSSRLARHRVSVRASAEPAGLVKGTVKLGGAAVRGATVRVVPAASVRRANARKWRFRGARRSPDSASATAWAAEQPAGGRPPRPRPGR